MLNVNMLSVTFLYRYAEFHYAEYCYADCRSAVCHSAPLHIRFKNAFFLCTFPLQYLDLAKVYCRLRFYNSKSYV
jgi:hypothetical protein